VAVGVNRGVEYDWEKRIRKTEAKTFFKIYASDIFVVTLYLQQKYLEKRDSFNEYAKNIFQDLGDGKHTRENPPCSLLQVTPLNLA